MTKTFYVLWNVMGATPDGLHCGGNPQFGVPLCTECRTADSRGDCPNRSRGNPFALIVNGAPSAPQLNAYCSTTFGSEITVTTSAIYTTWKMTCQKLRSA